MSVSQGRTIKTEIVDGFVSNGEHVGSIEEGINTFFDDSIATLAGDVDYDHFTDASYDQFTNASNDFSFDI